MQRLLRQAARLLRVLPDAWVRGLAGAPVRIRGRTLDPRLQLLARQAGRAPALHTLTPEEARAATDAAIALGTAPPRPLESVEERRVDGAEGDLRARLYRPHGLDGPRPLLLWFHQGGCVIGSLDWADDVCSRLATAARCLVLSVDYRKGPEHRFPAAQEDAFAAYRWALERAGELEGDPRRVAVGGDSAGGGLAAQVARRAAREGLRAPALQLLVYPWLVACAGGDAYRDFGDSYPLTRESMQWFLAHYLGDPEDAAAREDPRLSPGLADDLAALKGLAPALVYTAGFDLLCDEGRDYAERLEAAGVPVTFRCYESLAHSFTSLGGAVPAADRALDEIARDVDRALCRARL